LSTILKALRRLEEEKAATEEPRPLREQIARAPGAPTPPRRRGWGAAAVALVLGVGAGGGVIWWLFGGQHAQPEVVASAPAAPAPAAQPAPVAPPAAVPPPERQPGPPDQAFASDVEMVDRPDALPRLADTEPVQPGPAPTSLGAHRPVESSSAALRAREAALAEYQAAERARRGLPPEPVAPAPPQPAEPLPVIPTQADTLLPAPPEPAPAAVPAPPAPAPVAQTPAPPAPAPAPAPVVAEARPAPKPVVTPAAPKPKPAAPRAAPREEAPPPPPAPSIAVAVEKTQWHPLADRRSAWVRVPGQGDAQRVVEGDVIDGAIVSAIEPSGVVFERNGQKIRRALGQP
jgi:hypothetical protein